MSDADEIAALKDRIGLLEQQVGLFAGLSLQTLSGRWNGEDTGGELPHAAAALVALLGGEEAADQLGFESKSFSRG